VRALAPGDPLEALERFLSELKPAQGMAADG
jgi:hypothetical protein